jgi:hypothetical protein
MLRLAVFAALAAAVLAPAPGAAMPRHGPQATWGHYHHHARHLAAHRHGRLAARRPAAPRAQAEEAVPLPRERSGLLSIAEAKALLHTVDAELGPAILTNLDLDFAKACLMQYGLKRLEELKAEAER